jgi:hypothetical protein
MIAHAWVDGAHEAVNALASPAKFDVAPIPIDFVGIAG